MLLLLAGCVFSNPTKEGRAALDAHDLAAAEGAFRTALERQPDNIEALDGLGWTYLLAGQREAAAGAFDRCIELAPTNGARGSSGTNATLRTRELTRTD